MEKMGSPLHLATFFMGDHHGLTPNRLLSVFYVLFPVCIFGRLAGEKGSSAHKRINHEHLAIEQVYKSNSWRKSWPKNRNPSFLKSFCVWEKAQHFSETPFKFHLVSVRDYFSVTLNKLLFCYHLFLVGSTTF